MRSRSNYLSLASALKERLTIIGDHELREKDPSLQLNKLQTVSELILQLQKQLPDDCNPHLDHYLKNCSYDKALALVEKLLVESQ
jgi:hypothetical protein